MSPSSWPLVSCCGQLACCGLLYTRLSSPQSYRRIGPKTLSQVFACSTCYTGRRKSQSPRSEPKPGSGCRGSADALNTTMPSCNRRGMAFQFRVQGAFSSGQPGLDSFSRSVFPRKFFSQGYTLRFTISQVRFAHF